MSKMVLVPIWDWSDIKIGCFYKSRGVYRKVLNIIIEDGVKKAVVSYHVWAKNIIENKESFADHPEFKVPLYKFTIEKIKLFGAYRVTYPTT